MYSEAQDRSSRVRQIPINVEPRHLANEELRRPTSNRQHQMPGHNHNSQSPENSWSQRQAHSNNGHRQASPNTSSININYQPQEIKRDQSYETRSANSQTPRSSRESRGVSRDQPVDNNQGRGQDRSPLPRDASPNSDKKVSSPEPIPLPPPPDQQGQTLNDGSSPDASLKAKKNRRDEPATT